uniref:Filamin A interacting protein 1 n=1 Tax=Tetraodon nigroviridis TaxID=99883 RepID=H3CZD7_TETNG
GLLKKRLNAPQEEEKRKRCGSLSKKDLLHLLGVMEGEVQAREDIIVLLKSDRTGADTLEAHYGSSVPIKPLQALQRDGLLTAGPQSQDVYQGPMAELERLELKQKETYRRMLEQLLLAEKCHRRTVMELDEEKRKHIRFISKSDDFTNLLEQSEADALKTLLEQEKAYQACRDRDHNRTLEKVRAELVKLKSFALMLVEEHQLHTEQIDQQNQKIQDLGQKLQESEQRSAAVTAGAQEDGRTILRLEAELERRAARSAQEHKDMSTKLAQEESQSRQLRLKLKALSGKLQEVEERNRTLHQSEEELQELRQKISKGECGNSTLMAELENLRKKVLEMEGKDEEITKMENQCRELGKKLQDEENHGKELRLEVDQLQKRMAELEKLEGWFGRSKSECSQLQTQLEREKQAVKDLAGELERLKKQMKELMSSESKTEQAEMILKDDLKKLKSFTVLLVDERKTMEERLKQEEQRSESLGEMLKVEQGKVTEVTEKLIEESKKLLRFKKEMEDKVAELTKERDELKSNLAGEEDKCRQLNVKVNSMKARMDGLQVAEQELQRRWAKERHPDEHGKVQELTLEVDRLKNRLKQLEVVEGDLLKTEDQYDLLEKKFRTEQDKAKALAQMLEETKSQIAPNKGLEKGQVKALEAELRGRLHVEEARSRALQGDVQALKEKVHELMNKEDQLSQLQVDFSVLQQRFRAEEQRNATVSQEVDKLTAELEASRRYSRSLRPGAGAGRMATVPLTSTAVQTDAPAAEDDTAAGFIRNCVLEENHLMSNLRQQQGVRTPTVLDRYPPELRTGKSWIPCVRRKEAVPPAQTCHLSSGGASLLAPALNLAPKLGHPLRIRVTPDSGKTTATLEISSPGAEDFFSSTTIIPTLGSQKPRITIVPKATTHQAQSPVTITTISRNTCPEETSSDPLQAPVSIITVSTAPAAEACAPLEATVVKVIPEQPSGQAACRKHSSSIVTTDDNKIHIHLGPQPRRPPDGGSSPPAALSPRPDGGRDVSTGTVIRQTHRPSNGKTPPTTPGKMSSSITITPVTSAPSRPTRAAPCSDVQPRSSSTRIPLSRGTKPGSRTVLGVSSESRETWAESQSMKIELRKQRVCSSASTAGGKA